MCQEERPQEEFYSETKELKPPASFSGCRPEGQIRTFGGILRLMIDTSPGQLVSTYWGIFPMPANPAPVYNEAWGNFVQWVHKVRNEGLLAQQVRIGRRLYTQLRIIQTEAIAQPLQKDDPSTQAAMKFCKKQSAQPLSKAYCFRCGLIGHCSSTRLVQLQREAFKQKNNIRPRKQ
ncbi:hypothetical protein LSM04_007774 [Trypanosoma melophagium]|uniref:uncharacterized protein n=1 Tax=Trypanosoma melophagium TaxID=715481 RepID=UPI00351A5936|nr:hypothetical protein LSM04_007774 [Trypanosoma melophagium]